MARQYLKEERLGMSNVNCQGCNMIIVEYNDSSDIVVEFQDNYKARVSTRYDHFIKGKVWNPNYRIGEISKNNEGYDMIIVEYIDANNVIVEFQDKYKARVHSNYNSFQNGSIKNPYHTNVFNAGMIGVKYPSRIDGRKIKEYQSWQNMSQRCFDKKLKEKRPTYKDITCCDEWLNYENFYEWLHSQNNFDKWLSGEKWAVDKDILIKRNKIYNPNTCCLVPANVNCLFVKCNSIRGDLPIGVIKHYGKFSARCCSPFTDNKYECLGDYNTPEEAFYLGYKPFKEDIIKQVAKIEYTNGNITEKCYNAMMNYEVEITD